MATYIKEGTLIEIGTGHGHVRREAEGVVFRATRSGAEKERITGDVIKAPNGWIYSEIRHKVNLKYDKIVPETNKDGASSLERVVY